MLFVCLIHNGSEPLYFYSLIASVMWRMVHSYFLLLFSSNWLPFRGFVYLGSFSTTLLGSKTYFDVCILDCLHPKSSSSFVCNVSNIFILSLSSPPHLSFMLLLFCVLACFVPHTPSPSLSSLFWMIIILTSIPPKTHLPFSFKILCMIPNPALPQNCVWRPGGLAFPRAVLSSAVKQASQMIIQVLGMNRGPKRLHIYEVRNLQQGHQKCS